MTLPVDSQVAKTLFTVDEYLAEQRYAELTELLLNLAQTHGRDLVAVPGEKTPTVRRYLNVATYCQRLLATLPPAGRAVCRKQLDPQAKRWFEAWQTTRDDSHLQRILRTAYISSYGDNALWESGQAAWDRGDFSLAAATWGQLDPASRAAATDDLVYPDSEFPAAEVQARLILCEIFSRRRAAAERLLEQYRVRFPAAKGTLAGREGLWLTLLNDALRESQTWQPPVAEANLATFGGANERRKTWDAKLEIGPLRWSAQWPTRSLPQQRVVPAADRGPLKSFPVVADQHVFVSDGDAIRAWNILTGEPAWPNDQADPAIIYPPVPQETVPLPFRPCVGVPWQTLTFHQGKLYARMGSPLAGAASTERADQVSELVCLDVRTGQGKLLWKLSADDVPTNGPSWSFEGTPLVVEATAYVALYRRQPEAEFALLALDAESGEVEWLRTIGSARPSLDNDAVNRVSHLLLTSGDGRLYLSTDQGTILALSPQDGRLLWAVSYESQPVELQHGIPPHLQQGLLPPVFSQGLLFVAPNDSRHVTCLEAATGRVVWQQPQREERLRHLIGVTTSPRKGCLIAGGKSLWAFDVDDGTVVWRMIQHEPAERGYGQGLLSGASVFWPTREWLYQLNQTTGELERKIPLQLPDAPRSGGNLAVADGLLLIAEPDRIAAYGEYSLLKERLKIDLSQRPGDAAAWQRMMDLEAGADQWDAAIAAGRKAWALRGTLSAGDAAALQARWTAVLWRQIARLVEANAGPDAETFLTELSALPLHVEERGRLLWEWAQLDVRRDQPDSAVARLHELLALHLQSRLELNGESVHLLVRQQLDRILQSSGRAAFQDVHQRAEQLLATALSAGNVVEVRRILKRYPLLESSAEVWPRLITEHLRRAHWTAVWPLFEEWHAVAESDLARTVIHERKILALRQAGYARTATRLSAIPPADVPWKYVARAWQHAATSQSRAFIPQGVPPGDQLACVLSAGADLTAFDRRTGAVRWTQTSEANLLWTGYGETQLLLAANDSLVARSLETGERLWQRRWNLGATAPDLAAERLNATPERLIALEPARGLTAISSITGDVQWEFRPPRGRLQAPWAVLDDRLLIQTTEPSEVWLVEMATGRLLKSVSPSVPWRRAPVALGAGNLGCVAADRQLLACRDDLTPLWKYQGAMSHAHADPWLIPDGERLAVLIDGTTLVGLDPHTGVRRWGTGLADVPVTDAARQVAVGRGLAVSAWPSQLRAVSLDDGSIVWESTLPAGAARWTVEFRNGRFLAASGDMLLLFDPTAGRKQQLLKLSGGEKNSVWHLDEQGAVGISAGTISAWQPLEADDPRQEARHTPRQRD